MTASAENGHVEHLAALVGCVCLIAFFTGLGPSQALAQRGRARQMLDEAQAHEEAQRYAIAAQRYLQLYDVMIDARLPRAPVALWSAGFCLSHVAGREQDARDTLRRFLEASVPLAQEPDIQGFRSESVSIISELEARVPTEARAPTEARVPDTAEGQALGDPASGLSPIGPVLLAVGGAALVAGAIVGGVLVAENDSVVSRCPGGVCPAAAREQAEGLLPLALATDILIVAGAVIAATGLVLTFVLDGEDDANRAAAIGITGACGPKGCAIVARGAF